MPKKSRIFISWTKCRPYYCIYQYCIYLLERMIYVYGSVQWRESRTECPGPGLVQVKNSNFGHIFNNFPVPNLSRICPCVRTMFFPVQFPVVSCPSSQQWNSNKSDAARDVLAKGVCLFVCFGQRCGTLKMHQLPDNVMRKRYSHTVCLVKENGRETAGRERDARENCGNGMPLPSGLLSVDKEQTNSDLPSAQVCEQ